MVPRHGALPGALIEKSAQVSRLNHLEPHHSKPNLGNLLTLPLTGITLTKGISSYQTKTPRTAKGAQKDDSLEIRLEYSNEN